MAVGERLWVGWITFAGTMLVVIGMVNVFEGVVTLIWDERSVAAPDRFVLVGLTAWSWTVLLSGILLIATGAGLFSGRSWARIVAIVVVGLHLVSQVTWLGAYPVWSLLMIALDTVILFALTARWSEVRDEVVALSGPASARADSGNERIGPEAKVFPAPRIG
ncbi:hypothetical protein HH310_21785 [Actinoplanes sp. TBRC 11911]|uniref:DUF7144 family membrane protein n=1 Tax=Actinoplanes sp. TBRC 11911 TaxID=2729386 RepID=UPI00145EEB75|nr:hypothetical protein [Actinoplanes sp. TBRC 11911]NMO53802.1 hypothetical protein [Actinoplanes sp. TBRC 11911]